MTAGETYHDPSPAEPRSVADARTREAMDEVVAAEVTIGAREGEPELGAMTAKVAGNSLIQGVGKLLGYASGILTLALTTRLLTTANFGDYTIAVVYLIFVAVIADIGVWTIAVREGSKSPERLREIYHTAFTIRAISSTIIFTGCIALIFFLPYSQEAKLGTVILGVTTLLTTIGQGFDILFQVKLRLDIPTYTDLVSRIFVLGGTALLFVLSGRYALDSQTLYYAVIGVVAASYIIGFCGRWLGAHRMIPLRLALDPDLARALLRPAIPIFVVAILGQIHYKADAIILSLLRPATDVAIYGVAYRMVDFMVLFFTLFTLTVFPVLSAYSRQDAQRYGQAVRRVLDATFALSVPATAGVILLAPEIVAIVGGERYPESALPMQILSLAVVLSAVTWAYNYIIIVQNRQRNLVWITIVLVVANVGLNLYFVPTYSYIASAVATDVTTALGMALAIIVAMRHQSVRPSWRSLLKIVGATIAMLAAIQLLRVFVFPTTTLLGTAVMIAVGCVVYGTLLLVTGGVDDGVMLLLRRRLARLTGRAA